MVLEPLLTKYLREYRDSESDYTDVGAGRIQFDLVYNRFHTFDKK